MASTRIDLDSLPWRRQYGAISRLDERSLFAKPNTFFSVVLSGFVMNDVNASPIVNKGAERERPNRAASITSQRDSKANIWAVYRLAYFRSLYRNAATINGVG